MKQAGLKRRLPGKRVLVVEDDTATGEMLVAVLGMEDYTVTWVSSPAEAMRLLAAPDSDSDLVLLDLQLPVLSGDAMVGQLVAAGHRLPPVIVLSAKTHQTIDAAADSIRAAGVLYKPFAIDDLLDRVRHVLS